MIVTISFSLDTRAPPRAEHDSLRVAHTTVAMASSCASVLESTRRVKPSLTDGIGAWAGVING